MEINLGTLKAIKYAAILIERKYPGSCKGLLDTIDSVENHPLFLFLRAKAIESKWESVKEWYSKKENLDATEKYALFDISDSTHWEENYRKRWLNHLQRL